MNPTTIDYPIVETNAASAPPAARKSCARVIWVILLVFATIVAYAFLVEPYWVEVTHYEIQGQVAAPLKIAHLTDLHTHGIGRRERRMLEILAEEKPDLIVITGDSLGQLGPRGSHSSNYAECKDVYEQLHAPLGVWFVRGNWETWDPFRGEKAFYQDAGVHFLLNASESARPDVSIIGVDDPSTGTPKLDAALADAPAGSYTIALFHSPGYFDRVAGRVNLCLSGHTHGGQVRLPFFRPFWLPSGCGRYVEGWYTEQGSKMYVSRGIGTSVIPARLLSRPEIAFITIHP
jgi:predicted MPP superfamily phosphohydrolase